jgi:hypothetical protein
MDMSLYRITGLHIPDTSAVVAPVAACRTTSRPVAARRDVSRPVVLLKLIVGIVAARAPARRRLRLLLRTRRFGFLIEGSIARIELAVRIAHDRELVGAHVREPRERVSREAHGKCYRRGVADESGERSDRLIANEIRHGVHVARHRRSIARVEPRRHLDAGVGVQRRAHRRINLREKLMREDDANFLLASL